MTEEIKINNQSENNVQEIKVNFATKITKMANNNRSVLLDEEAIAILESDTLELSENNPEGNEIGENFQLTFNTVEGDQLNVRGTVGGTAEVMEVENNPGDNAGELSDDSVEFIEVRQNVQETIELNSETESTSSGETPEITEDDITELIKAGESREEAKSRLTSNDQAWINRSIA